MLVLCIDRGNGDPSEVTLPEPGVVYRVLRVVKSWTYEPTGSNEWYILDRTGIFYQNPVLFESLPDDYLTNLLNINVKQNDTSTRILTEN